MNAVSTFVPIILALYLALASGYALRRLALFQQDISRPVIRYAVLYLEPVVLFLIMWNLDLTQPGRIIALPLFGLGVASIMFVPGWLGARLFGLTGTQRGAFISCAMMSNLGLTMGAFVCYLFLKKHGLGDQGASLGIAWCLYFLPFVVAVMFNLARHYGAERGHSFGAAVKDYLTNPLSRNLNTGLLAGILLNAFHVPHFPGFPAVQAVGIYADVVVCSFAIGYGLQIGKSVRYLREGLGMCVLKFLVCPLVGIGLFFAVKGLTGMPVLDSTVLAVVLIQSSMPVAIFAIVVATLFDLDRDLANACWIVTTTLSLVTVVVLYLIVQVILGPPA